MAIGLLEEEQGVRQTNADHSFPGTRINKRGGSTHGYLRTLYDTLRRKYLGYNGIQFTPFFQ